MLSWVITSGDTKSKCNWFLVSTYLRPLYSFSTSLACIHTLMWELSCWKVCLFKYCMVFGYCETETSLQQMSYWPCNECLRDYPLKLKVTSQKVFMDARHSFRWLRAHVQGRLSLKLCHWCLVVHWISESILCLSGGEESFQKGVALLIYSTATDACLVFQKLFDTCSLTVFFNQKLFF